MENKEENYYDSNVIYGGFKKSEDFQQKLHNFFTNKGRKAIVWWFNTKEHRISEKYLSYKVVNDWEKAGIIINNREDNKGWREYSIMDHIWLFTAKQLRHFGVKLDKIAKIRKELFQKIQNSEYGILEYYSHIAFFDKKPVYLLFFNNDLVEIATDEEILLNEGEFTLLSHIKININHILQDMFRNSGNFTKNASQSEFTDEEVLILNKLRDPEHYKISIIKDKNIPEIIELTKSVSIKENVNQLKNKSSHHRVELTTHNYKDAKQDSTTIKKIKNIK